MYGLGCVYLSLDLTCQLTQLDVALAVFVVDLMMCVLIGAYIQ